MKSQKKLLFLENRQHAAIFVEKYKTKKNLSDAVIYVFSEDAEDILIKNNLGYKRPEEIITFKDIRNIDKDSIIFAKNWYRRNKRLYISLLYGGVSLGSIIQRDMAFFISNILDAIVLSRKVIEYENPDEVYYFKGPCGKVSKSIRASVDETYYGYFSSCFADKTKILKSGIVSGNNSEECEDSVFVDYEKQSVNNAKKNILMVNDMEYLDPGKRLNAVLGSYYNIKYLKKRHNVKKTRMESMKELSKIDKTFFTYKGVNFFNLMQRKFRYLEKKAFPYFKRLLKDIAELLVKENVDCLIATEDATPFNKTVISAASSVGIRTIVLQKGLCAHDISFVPVTADKFAAWGNDARDYLLRRGVPKDKVEITGCPRFQNYGKRKVTGRGKVLKDLKINGRYNNIFLVTLQHGNRDMFFRNVHITFYEELEMIKMLIRVMEQFPEDLLCFKFHPQDRLGKNIFKFLRRKMPQNIKSVHNYPIENLLAVSNVLITCFSTTVLEAILMNVPVIIMNIFKRPFNVDFTKKNVARLACNDNDLIFWFNKVKKDSFPKGSVNETFIDYHFLHKNLNAAENIKCLIDNLIKN